MEGGREAGSCSLFHPCSLVTSDPEALVRTCCEHWPAVQLWEVAMLCSTDQSHCKSVSHDDPDQSQERLSVGTEVFSHDSSRIDMYGDYLSRLLGNRDSGEGVVEMVRCDEEMIVASLEMMLSRGPPLQDLVADGGHPR